nr:bifunctional DNA-formamidopyrimidine glycosylase/DNA-(apurinic or apyrimidinic site) lyase [Demequina sp. TTPB684]
MPEVETVRAGLEGLVVGSRIDGVSVYRDSCVRLQPGGPGEFEMALQGMVLGAAVRRGKFLWLPLLEEEEVSRRLAAASSGGALSAHLGMSGQFRVFPGDAPDPHPHCRVRLHLKTPRGTGTLDFLDQRTFGYLLAEPTLATPDGRPGGHGSDAAAVPLTVAHIARDVLDPAVDERAVLERMRRGSRGIKQVLLDQTVMSGIGNIYADEALWAARVHPERPANALSLAQARALLAAAREVMAKALDQGGTSFDALYVNVNGESGYFSRSLQAYGRTGEDCTRCGGRIVQERIGGRSTHWCPRCQRRFVTRTAKD